jgi:hypothetical protein
MMRKHSTPATRRHRGRPSNKDKAATPREGAAMGRVSALRKCAPGQMAREAAEPQLSGMRCCAAPLRPPLRRRQKRGDIAGAHTRGRRTWPSAAATAMRLRRGPEGLCGRCGEHGCRRRWRRRACGAALRRSQRPLPTLRVRGQQSLLYGAHRGGLADVAPKLGIEETGLAHILAVDEGCS